MDAFGFSWRDTGAHFGENGYAFSEPGFYVYHKELFANEGYSLMDNIAKEDNNLFDNQVWRVREHSTGMVRACKVACLKYYERPDLNSALEAMLRETDILQRLDHKNIIKLLTVFQLPEPSTGFQFSFNVSVMELMSGTLESLQNKYPNQRMPVSSVTKNWFRDVGEAIDYLHNGIAGGIQVSHLAIRPVNILFAPKYTHFGINTYKLTDFEESVVLLSSEEDVFPNWKGMRPNGWSAPEIRSRNPFGKPTRPMDIFSFGKTLLTNILGTDMSVHNKYIRYYTNASPAPVLTDIEANLFSKIPRSVAFMAFRMIQRDSNQRPTIEEVMSDPFIQDLVENK